MKSMTAYAQTSVQLNGKKYRLELQTLNKKGLDIQIDLPYAFSNLNIPVRLYLSSVLERGSVFFRLKEELSDKMLASVHELESVKKRLQELALSTGFSKDVVTFEMLLEKASSAAGIELEFTQLEMTMSDLVRSLVEMRTQEGERLKIDFSSRLGTISQVLHQVESIQEGSLTTIKEKLLERLQALKLTHIDEERLAKEVIYYVEKQDVTEELTRLKSHIVQFKKILTETVPVGRKLEFLVQECFRELNTLSAKTSQLESINLCLMLKTEFEKLKEQIMNIE